MQHHPINKICQLYDGSYANCRQSVIHCPENHAAGTIGEHHWMARNLGSENDVAVSIQNCNVDALR